MSNEVVIKMKGDKRGLDDSLKQSEDSIKRFGGGVKKIFAAIGVAIAAKKIFDFGAKLFSLYKEQEQSEARLEAVLKATGNAAGFSADQMKQMAADMQKVTKFGDETVMQTQAIIATFRNIHGDQFKETTMVAADLATVLQTDLKSAALQVGKAMNDPVKGVTMLTRAGVQFTDAQKEMIKKLQESGDIVGAQTVVMNELQQQMGGAAAAAANTFSGRLQQVQNSLGDMGEKLFSVVVPALEGLLPVIDAGIVAFGNMMTNLGLTTDTFAGMSEFITTTVFSVLEKLLEIAVGSFTGIQVAWANTQNAITIGMLKVAAITIGAWEDIKHMFTHVMPSVLTWFAGNWATIMTDLINFTSQVTANMQTNLSSFLINVALMLKGGKTDFQWTALTDGFETSLKELPIIAERELSGMEQALSDQIKDAGDNGFMNFGEQYEKNMQGLKDLFSDEAIDTTAPDLEAAARGEFDPGLSEKAKEKKKGGGKGSVSMTGLAALNNKITEAAAGRRNNEQKRQEKMSSSLDKIKMVNEQQKKSMDDQNTKLDKQNSLLTEIRDKDAVGVFK